MREKIKQIPVGVMIVLFILALVAVGLSAFKTMQKSDVSYTVPMDRQRYMNEMKRRAGNSGMSVYQTSGQGGGGRSRMSGEQSSRGGYGGYSSYGQAPAGGGR